MEDSPAGAASAGAAGMAVAVVPGVRPVPPAPGRSRFASLRELGPAELARLAGGAPTDPLAAGRPGAP